MADDLRTVAVPQDELSRPTGPFELPVLANIGQPISVDDPRVLPAGEGVGLAALGRLIDRIAPSALRGESRVEGVPAGMSDAEALAMAGRGNVELPAESAINVDMGQFVAEQGPAMGGMGMPAQDDTMMALQAFSQRISGPPSAAPRGLADPAPSDNQFVEDNKRAMAESMRKRQEGAALVAKGEMDQRKAQLDGFYRASQAHELRRRRAAGLRDVNLKELEEQRKKLEARRKRFDDDFQIDPNRFAKNASPLQKVLLALGAAFSAKGGSPVGLMMIQQLIQRDVQSQMSDRRRQERLLRDAEDALGVRFAREDQRHAAELLANREARRDAMEALEFQGRLAPNDAIKGKALINQGLLSAELADNDLKLHDLISRQRQSDRSFAVQREQLKISREQLGVARTRAAATLAKATREASGLIPKENRAAFFKDMAPLDKALTNIETLEQMVARLPPDLKDGNAPIRGFLGNKAIRDIQSFAGLAAPGFAKAQGQVGNLSEAEQVPARKLLKVNASAADLTSFFVDNSPKDMVRALQAMKKMINMQKLAVGQTYGRDPAAILNDAARSLQRSRRQESRRAQ